MSTTAGERARAYLRLPPDGRSLALGVVAGIVGGLVLAAVAAALGVEDSLPAQVAVAVGLGLVVGLALRLWSARRGRSAPDRR
jgi:hypothetical protein